MYYKFSPVFDNIVNSDADLEAALLRTWSVFVDAESHLGTELAKSFTQFYVNEEASCNASTWVETPVWALPLDEIPRGSLLPDYVSADLHVEVLGKTTPIWVVLPNGEILNSRLGEWGPMFLKLDPRMTVYHKDGRHEALMGAIFTTPPSALQVEVASRLYLEVQTMEAQETRRLRSLQRDVCLCEKCGEPVSPTDVEHGETLCRACRAHRSVRKPRRGQRRIVEGLL